MLSFCPLPQSCQSQLLLLFLRFFMIGYLGIGFEFAAELTYPIPEGTSSGILIVTSELFGIIFTVIGGEMLNTYGDMVTNFTLVGLLAVGFIITMLINGTDLRRLAATTGIRNQTTQHALTCQVSDCSFKPSVMHDSTIFSTSHLSWDQTFLIMTFYHKHHYYFIHVHHRFLQTWHFGNDGEGPK